jgi:uncharacterized protein YbjT (DUF2867 family)
LSEKILVTGATGTTGSGVAATLLGAGADVRVFVRNEEKAQSLKDQGAEVIVGDLDRPETIEPAVQGVDKIYYVNWNGPTAQQNGLDFIEAVKATGENPLVVLHSAWGSPKSRIIQQLDQIEEALKSSGLRWMILKPTFYMQNTIMAAPTINSDGAIYWDWNDGKAGMIDVRDIVDSAVGALIGSGQEGESYVLTGPESLSFSDVAAKLSDVLGKPISYVSVPHEAAKEGMMGMGFPEWIVDGYVELSQGFSENFADSVTENVEQLSGHPARSFEQCATDFKAAFEG